MRCAKLAALAGLVAFLLAGCSPSRDVDAQLHIEGQGAATSVVPRLEATLALVLTGTVDPGAALPGAPSSTPSAGLASVTSIPAPDPLPTDTPLAVATEGPAEHIPGPAPTAGADVDPVAAELFTFDPAAWDQSLETLSSFRQKVVLDFTADDSGMHSKVTYDGEVTVAPGALHSLVRVEGQGADALPSTQVELVWIGDQVWVKVGRRPWIAVSTSAVESEYGGEVVGVGDLLPLVQQAGRVLPDETVNGIPCRHYVYDTGNLQTDVGMTSAQGDIWVARDGGYVVRLTLSGHGTYSDTYSTSGTLDLVYDLYDVNLPISISPPR